MDIFKSLIEDIIEVTKKNRWIVFTALGVGIALVLFFMIMSGVGELAKRHNEASQSVTTEAVTEDADGIEATTYSVDESSNPTDEQRKAIDAYGADERSLLDVLSSMTWVGPSGKPVKFSGTTYTFDGSDKSPFAITAVSKGDPVAATFTDNETVSYTDQTTMMSVLDQDGKTTICTLTKRIDDSGASWTLVGSPFADGETLTAKAAAASFSMDISPDLANLIGNDTNGVNKAIKAWSTDNAPSATSGTWDGSVKIDWRENVTSFDVMLNDASNTKVTVWYNMTSKGFAVEKAEA